MNHETEERAENPSLQRAGSLRPTLAGIADVLASHPALTAAGYYSYERNQRENDQRTKNGQHPIAHTPPIPLDRTDVLDDISVSRLFFREECGERTGVLYASGNSEPEIWVGDRIGVFTSLNVKREIERWAGKSIWHGAVIAAAVMEGWYIRRYGSVTYIGGEFPLKLHTRLEARAARDSAARAAMDAALDCVPGQGQTLV